jgi:D-glycero-alpha-D-manno-heptose-7-phosphate kinase
MIIVQVPVRLPLGGGGTDLPSYCHQFGGHLITASINKHIYITINQPITSDKIKLFYSHIEVVDSVDEIKHNIIRECLRYFNINFPIEINTSADLAGSTGMGSSSAFTVGLLKGLSFLIGYDMDIYEIAELASHIEIDILKSPIGKQDQYASAFGGINELLIDTTDHVSVFPMNIDHEQLQNRLLMLYTNIQRDANEVLREIDKLDVYEALHEIKQIGCSIKQVLKDGNIDSFGELLHQHWIVKKTISPKMSNDFIDDCYRVALKNGALGGKIMGAGGGGFLLICFKEGRKYDVINSLNMKVMDFRFEFGGAKIIL